MSQPQNWSVPEFPGNQPRLIKFLENPMRFFDEDLTALVSRITAVAVGTEGCSEQSPF
jgi:hypothetical protein